MKTTKTVAQVAAEAIVNDPHAYEEATVLAVLTVAAREGVSDVYLEPIREAFPAVAVEWAQAELTRQRRDEVKEGAVSVALRDAEKAIGSARLALTEEAEGDLLVAIANLNLASSTLVRVVTSW